MVQIHWTSTFTDFLSWLRSLSEFSKTSKKCSLDGASVLSKFVWRPNVSLSQTLMCAVQRFWLEWGPHTRHRLLRLRTLSLQAKSGETDRGFWGVSFFWLRAFSEACDLQTPCTDTHAPTLYNIIIITVFNTSIFNPIHKNSCDLSDSQLNHYLLKNTPPFLMDSWTKDSINTSHNQTTMTETLL